MTTISYPLQDEKREAVRQLLDAFGDIWPDSRYGPLHILIDDYNALDHNLEFCRKRLRETTADSASRNTNMARYGYDPHDNNEGAASFKLLDLLQLMPEAWRDIHAEGVDDD